MEDLRLQLRKYGTLLGFNWGELDEMPSRSVTTRLTSPVNVTVGAALG